MQADLLVSILNELNSTTSDIEASAVISVDGLTIASAMPLGSNENRVGIISAYMHSLGNSAVQELNRGELEQILIKGADSYVVMTGVGTEAILTVLARQNAKLDSIIPDVQRAAKNIQMII